MPGFASNSLVPTDSGQDLGIHPTPVAASPLTPFVGVFVCLFVLSEDREKNTEKGFLQETSQESHAFRALTEKTNR